MPEIIVILRTHFVDDSVLDLAASLHREGEYRVVFAVDESRSILDTTPYDKVSLTRERFAALDLLEDRDDIFWRAGDYVLYCARDQYPDAERFWVIEYDVFINRQDPSSFLREIDAVSDHDLLSTHYREPENWWWGWTEPLRDIYPKPMRCYYPLVRLSVRAVDYLFSERVRLSRIEQAIPRADRKTWANDEAFTAMALHNGGFRAADFSELGDYYTHDTFWMSVLRHPNHLPAFDGLLYHAVRGGRHYIDTVRWGGSFTPPVSPRELIVFYPDLDAAALFDLMSTIMTNACKTMGDDPGRHFADNRFMRRLLDAAPTSWSMKAVVQTLARQRKFLCLDWLRRNRGFENWPSIPELDNLALCMPANQSSVSQWSSSPDCRLDAAGGNDGRLDIDFGFHTDIEPHAYWSVDLGREVRLTGVRIYNRRQHWERLRNFHILLSSDGIDWQIGHRSEVGDVQPDQDALRINLEARARFVRIELPHEGALHLREVQVFGGPA